MKVLYSRLSANDIFNGNDPGLLWNVAKEYRESWWGAEFDELRCLLRNTFVKEFDRLTGHYTNLRRSIEQQGITDPIVITSGTPLRRESWMVPENVKYLCESVGGSRLLIAQELDLDVPCIINDTAGVDGKPLLKSDVVALLPNYRVDYGPPCIARPIRYSHMDHSYTFEEQQRCRRLAKSKQIQVWKMWKEQNMSASGR